MMDLEAVLRLLRQSCDDAGSQTEWAHMKKISVAHVNNVLNGRRMPGNAVLTAMDLTRVMMYEPRKPRRARP